jgi:hypothetical protein
MTSIPTAWVFMDILKRLPHKPKKNNMMINCQVAAAKAIIIKVRGKNIDA